jgi:hypothetical protein
MSRMIGSLVVALTTAACAGGDETSTRGQAVESPPEEAELECQHGYADSSGDHLQEWRSDLLLGEATSLPATEARLCDGPIRFYTQRQCPNGTYSDSCGPLIEHWSDLDRTIASATASASHLATASDKQPACATFPQHWASPGLRYTNVQTAYTQALAAGQPMSTRAPLLKTMMLTYEMYGHKPSTHGGLSSSQLAHARSLYADPAVRDALFEPARGLRPMCGNTTAIECAVPNVTVADAGKMTRCSRLLGGHVDPAHARQELEACVSYPAATINATNAPACQVVDLLTLTVTDPFQVLDPQAVGIYDYEPNCAADQIDPSNPDGAACFRKRASHVTLVDTGCGYEIGERVGPGPFGWTVYARTIHPQDPGCPPQGGYLNDLNPGTFNAPDADYDDPSATADIGDTGEATPVVEFLDGMFSALWQKQLGFDPSIAAAPDDVAVAALGAQLRALDVWNDVNAQIGRARSGGGLSMSVPEFALFEGDQAGALTQFWGALWHAYDATPSILGAIAALPCEEDDVGTDPDECQEDVDEQLAILKTEMGESRATGKRAVQQLVKALFTSVQTPSGMAIPFTRGAAPVQRLFFPLLAGSLEMLDSRLEELLVYHDFACLFKPCAEAPSQLSRAYRLLAHLDTQRTDSTLAQVLAEPMGSGRGPLAPDTLGLGGWKAVFQRIAGADHWVLDQLWIDYRREDGPEDFVDPDSVRFRNLVLDAQVRDDNYRESGQLTTGSNVLSAGVTTDKLGDLSDRLGERTAELRVRKQQLEQNLRELTRDAIGYAKDTGSHESVKKTAEGLREEYDYLGDKIRGLADNVRNADVGFADMVLEHQTLANAVDQNEVFQIGDSQTFQVTAANGSNADPDMFNPECDNSDCVVPSRFAHPYEIRVDHPKSSLLIEKGEILQVKTTGVYAPICALRGATIKTPSGGFAFDAEGSVVGPEGYYLARQSGSFVAKSFTQSHGTHSDIGNGLVTKLTFGLFSAGRNASDSKVENFGDEHRWSATFSAALQVSNTPYNQLPVGALLMVTERVGGGPVDVQVVREGMTTLIPTANSRVTFVVNDVRCPEDEPADQDHALTVQYTKLGTQGAYLSRILDSMSEVLYGATATTQGPRDPIFEVGTYVAQGALLPADVANIQSYALTKLDQKLEPQLDLDEVPDPLLRMFNSFVTREIARIARGVEISNIKRRQREIVIELQGLNPLIAQGEKLNYLHEVHLARLLSQIDERVLQRSATELLRSARERLYPALKIWYPEVLAGLALDATFLAELDKLSLNASLDPTKTVSAWIGGSAAIENVLDILLDEIEDAAEGDYGPGESPIYLTLAIPKPTGRACPTGAPYCMPSPHTYQPGSRTVDPIRARAFWEAFYSSDPEVQRHVPLSIVPDDLYSVSDSTQGLLGCHDVSAVVRRVGFTFGHVDGYGDADGPGGLNQMIRYLAGYTPREQLFVTAAGWEKFTLAPNTPFEIFSGRAAYGFVFAPLVSINAHSNSARPTGLSPFGDFELDVWGALHGGWFFVNSEHDAAQDVTIVLEVDSRRSDAIAPGIARCDQAGDPTP